MPTALVLRHVHFEDLGAFAAPMRAAGCRARILDVGVDALRPGEVEAADLLVVLGGPVAAYKACLYPGSRHRKGLDLAHITGSGGQVRVQNAGWSAMNASASLSGRTAPNGPAGPQASRRHHSTSKPSLDGSGFRRAIGAPVRADVSV